MGFTSNIMTLLPDDCVSRIFSLTSPKDACKMLVVSNTCRVPAESNIVWDEFLPSDYSKILSSTTCNSSLNSTSKKELFFLLSNYILIDGGNKAFSLDKSSGRKCCIISARQLAILHGDVDTNWRWKFMHESRFSEVAELITTSHLQIHGKIKTRTLSPNTKYGAYMIIKISDHSFGLDSIPCEISITKSGTNHNLTTTNTAYLRNPDSNKRQLECLFYRNRVEMLNKRVDHHKGDERVLQKRGDGWLEIEIGEFFVDNYEKDEEMSMNLREVKGQHMKGGIIVQGIEVRPEVF